MIKYLGIYLDYEEALLISLVNGQVSIKKIASLIDHSNVKGGARSKQPYGPQDNVSESKGLNRKRNQTSQYFKSLIPYIKEVSSLLLIGHGRAKNEFAALIKKDNLYKQLPVSIENANKLTDNQVVAKVKKFYNISPTWQL